jgi:4-hydroxy-tetrahydrodipicolinate reductase
VAHIISTTGLSQEDLAAIMRAGNGDRAFRQYEPGVNLLLALVERTARSLAEGWDIEIVEMHHRMKVDAPPAPRSARRGGRARSRNRPRREQRAGAMV